MPDYNVCPLKAYVSCFSLAKIISGLDKNILHQNLYITLFLGYKAENMFIKQPCYMQTKMYRLYRKLTIYGHFSISAIHFGGPPSNCVISKTVLK